MLKSRAIAPGPLGGRTSDDARSARGDGAHRKLTDWLEVSSARGSGCSAEMLGSQVCTRTAVRQGCCHDPSCDRYPVWRHHQHRGDAATGQV